MSYPNRLPMVPSGIPPFMPNVMPPVHNMPPNMMGGIRPFRHQNATSYSGPPVKNMPPEAGPKITVFVGNIAEHAPDLMVKCALAACGQIVSWKRTQGFGFCEFGSPESALRATRLLHDLPLGPKKLVVTVDKRTNDILDKYKNELRRQQGKPEVKSGSGNLIHADDYLDDRMRNVDRTARERILKILDDFQGEMENALAEKSEEDKFTKELKVHLPDGNSAQKTQQLLEKLSSADPNIQPDVEEGKRELITREIGKFREIMKKQEAEREEERLRREHDKEKRKSSPTSKADTPTRSARSRSQSLSSERKDHSRHRNRHHNHNHSKRDRDRDRERDRDRGRDHRSGDRNRDHRDHRDRDRDRESQQQQLQQRERGEKLSASKVDKLTDREREEEEEEKERKKQEKRNREKEVAYQERVRAWETRERRKRKEYDKEREKELQKQQEIARDAKRLKEFLEDYDDERDDSKYYKGRELQKRMFLREREKETDEKDRQQEAEEIEELKNKIMEGEHSDPTALYEQIMQEREELYKPKIIIDVNAEQKTRQKEREEREKAARDWEDEEEEEERQRVKSREVVVRDVREEKGWETPPTARGGIEEVEDVRGEKAGDIMRRKDIEEEDDDDGGRGLDDGLQANDYYSDQDSRPATGSPANTRKKKLDIREVFNTNDDDDSGLAPRKRKLVPIDYGDDKQKKRKDGKTDDNINKDDDENSNKDDGGKSTEEKRKNIKSLIDKIPTEKSALFAFTIDWSAVDNQLMERRIRPWINKKIIEYIGEPEPTLVDFICSKVLAGSQPQSILDDVQMVLDDEAEVFVVKMWRLLIYEIEAKKLGFVK